MANAVAELILEGFGQYREHYISITSEAKRRFLTTDWESVQDASVQRIRLYNRIKTEVCEAVRSLGHNAVGWRAVRRVYVELLSDRIDRELAATFYNSVYRRLSDRNNLTDEFAFVSDDPRLAVPLQEGLTQTYEGNHLDDVLREALVSFDLAKEMIDIETDIARISQMLAARIPLLREVHVLKLEVLQPVFYRNKGAYLVGHLLIDEHIIPVAIALMHSARGVIVDAFLWGESRLSVLFSFTRSYFMVDFADPMQIVDYLQTLLPAKKRWELLTAIGFFKHGKTEFVRGYRRHLQASNDKFMVAEGIKGQVMMVFGLTSYQTVFKVMKDRFPATKTVSHDDVRQAYQLVKSHDRVGRMADTQEFHVFEFPRDRFDPALLEELSEVASESVKIVGSKVTVSHLWTERMMTPLNLYIQRCGDFQLTQVLDDYGYAIKDLAAANIFPGDMLLKNFGVTRHGRVVFYDYDEICYLTDVNFRELPASDSSSGGMQAEPWFDVGEYDVFPEEFSTFLFPDENMQMRFRTHHADLFTASGWQSIQEQVRSGQISDIFPYPLQERLHQ